MLMVEKETDRAQLFVVAIAASHVCGPCTWRDNELEIVRAPDGEGYLVRDAGADFALRCDSVTVVVDEDGSFELR